MKTSLPKPCVSGLSIGAGEVMQLSVYVHSESIFELNKVINKELSCFTQVRK